MKKLILSSLFSFLLVASSPLRALGALPVQSMASVKESVESTPSAGAQSDRMESQLKRYAEMDPEQRCATNRGAGIDTKAGKEYKSACIASYQGAKEAAQKYLDDKKKGEAEIQALTAQGASLCGANRTPAAQVSCFKQAELNYNKASQLQAKLANDLLAAHNKAQKWREQNAKALLEYRNDLKKIEAVENEAKSRAEAFRRDGDSRAAAMAISQMQKAPAVTASGVSVAAKDGAASTLSEYKAKFSSLTQEQTESQEHATRFANTAKTEASALMQRSVDFQEMANKARAQAAASATGGTDPNGSTVSGHKVPTPADGRAARAEFEARQKTEANAGADPKSNPGGTTSGQPSSTGNENTATNGSSASSASPNSAANAAAAAAPAAAGMMGAGGGGSAASSGGSGGSADPFAGMNSASASENNSAQPEKMNPRSTNFGEVLGTSDPHKNSQAPATASAEEPVANEGNTPGLTASGSLSADSSEDNSGASSAPGIRGADGKPIRTGFSSAAGGSLQSSRRDMDRDAAPRDQFAPDLKSGAVSIAGSEMKSAMQSLAEEFGAADLDLNLGDLGGEEKTALAPLDGGASGEDRNTVAVKNGRRPANQSQGSDTSIQDEQSVALFSRSRSAHERALKRGNLILGTRKKL